MSFSYLAWTLSLITNSSPTSSRLIRTHALNYLPQCFKDWSLEWSKTCSDYVLIQSFDLSSTSPTPNLNLTTSTTKPFCKGTSFPWFSMKNSTATSSGSSVAKRWEGCSGVTLNRSSSKMKEILLLLSIDIYTIIGKTKIIVLSFWKR